MSSGIRRRASSSTSAGSSTQRTPWSIRSAPSRSIASRTPAGPLDSPAWAQRRRPAAPARAKASTNRSLWEPPASLPSMERASTRGWAMSSTSSTSSFGLAGALVAAQAHAEAGRGVALGRGVGEAGVERVDHRPQVAPPAAPVAGVHDHVDVAGPRRAGPGTDGAGDRTQLFGPIDQAAGPVEVGEQLGQARDRDPAVAAGDGGSRAVPRRRGGHDLGREAALEVEVHLRLRETDDEGASGCRGVSGHGRPSVAGGQCRPIALRRDAPRWRPFHWRARDATRRSVRAGGLGARPREALRGPRRRRQGQLRDHARRVLRVSRSERRGEDLDDAHDLVHVAARRRDAAHPRAGPGDRRPEDPVAYRARPPGGHARPRAHGARQPHHLRALLRPVAQGDP